jgi:hypothetical protein
MFTIINKQTNEFFAGFKSNKPVFTTDKSKAWAKSLNEAKLQASCFIANGIAVQRKPVAL